MTIFKKFKMVRYARARDRQVRFDTASRVQRQAGWVVTREWKEEDRGSGGMKRNEQNRDG